jgi:SsrA-binding protein
MYFKQALVKVEIAVCKGKKLYDKRAALKEKEAKRETQRAQSFRHG